MFTHQQYSVLSLTHSHKHSLISTVLFVIRLLLLFSSSDVPMYSAQYVFNSMCYLVSLILLLNVVPINMPSVCRLTMTVTNRTVLFSVPPTQNPLPNEQPSPFPFHPPPTLTLTRTRSTNSNAGGRPSTRAGRACRTWRTRSTSRPRRSRMSAPPDRRPLWTCRRATRPWKVRMGIADRPRYSLFLSLSFTSGSISIRARCPKSCVCVVVMLWLRSFRTRHTPRSTSGAHAACWFFCLVVIAFAH